MFSKYSDPMRSELESSATSSDGDESLDEEYGPDLESGITGSGSESGSGDDDSGDDDDGDGGDGGDGGGDGGDGGCSTDIGQTNYDNSFGQSTYNEAGDDAD